jgi:hypothetical protein
MKKIKSKLYKSNWITYLTMHIIVSILAVILPNNHTTNILNYVFWTNVLHLLYGMIPNLIYLSFIIVLDYFFFKKDAIKVFFIEETIIILSIILLAIYFGGVLSNKTALGYLLSIVISQFFRYKYIVRYIDSVESINLTE